MRHIRTGVPPVSVGPDNEFDRSPAFAIGPIFFHRRYERPSKAPAVRPLRRDFHSFAEARPRRRYPVKTAIFIDFAFRPVLVVAPRHSPGTGVGRGRAEKRSRRPAGDAINHGRWKHVFNRCVSASRSAGSVRNAVTVRILIDGERSEHAPSVGRRYKSRYPPKRDGRSHGIHATTSLVCDAVRPTLGDVFTVVTVTG